MSKPILPERQFPVRGQVLPPKTPNFMEQTVTPRPLNIDHSSFFGSSKNFRPGTVTPVPLSFEQPMVITSNVENFLDGATTPDSVSFQQQGISPRPQKFQTGVKVSQIITSPQPKFISNHHNFMSHSVTAKPLNFMSMLNPNFRKQDHLSKNHQIIRPPLSFKNNQAAKNNSPTKHPVLLRFTTTPKATNSPRIFQQSFTPFKKLRPKNDFSTDLSTSTTVRSTTRFRPFPTNPTPPPSFFPPPPSYPTAPSLKSKAKPTLIPPTLNSLFPLTQRPSNALRKSPMVIFSPPQPVFPAPPPFIENTLQPTSKKPRTQRSRIKETTSSFPISTFTQSLNDFGSFESSLSKQPSEDRDKASQVIVPYLVKCLLLIEMETNFKN